MIAFLDGVVAWREDDAVVLEVGGVGWRVFTTATALANVEPGMRMRLFTVQHVREDAFLLFGFAVDVDRKLFVRLQEVGGIGPRLALQMLNRLDADAIIRAVVQEDIKTLSSIPGIGQKTAQRLVLELRDRLRQWGAERNAESGTAGAVRLQKRRDLGSVRLEDVRSALTNLGFSDKEAETLIAERSSELETGELEDAIRVALKALRRR